MRSVPSLDVRLCFFGDSFTAGVGDEARLGWVGRVCARTGQSGHEVTAYNLGVRRETSLEVVDRLRREAAPRLREGARRGVVLAVGVNDTTEEDGRRRVEVDETLGALRAFTSAASSQSWEVLVIGPPFVGDPIQNQRIRALSKAMRGECDLLDVPFVDLATSLGTGEAWERRVNAIDGAHPDGTGYQQLADTIWPVFSAWLRRSESSG